LKKDDEVRKKKKHAKTSGRRIGDVEITDLPRFLVTGGGGSKGKEMAQGPTQK